ncbi:MAG: hypothetical protein A2729_03775 [Candidatus Buchananbacteria bacterium RIFCSPHIGHO2_01_FULL_39_14]|uniref:AprE-like beta-barrel domain-containing protein n=2 Tax=Candidatus Buchananiibacteriota TaxID=1817903 RepID=A0A1G1YPM5_9BACT|nr:MAG: hypothetical protein A2729_03775 [Candidatus Buchananbacteria bacterium RIFCSPHIGHO2_01_FULL_39_14]OGY48496.1 MAG: hypothetical protein A3D39_04955 [Candidatus Buchananbacteria bacterium RIFCSPHIGHO2_02_FULL_39_17]OGY54251.1 MAG: hypothetical protein A2912_04385 [Candidatus Buchananbacteria bacterium RIFCSPLOWO2_01_FULL_40_23b]
MKKLIKSKIFWVVFVIFLVGGFISARFFGSEKKVEYVTQDVILGDLKQTVSATGKVKSATEIGLNFKNTGKLNILNVKVGDHVSGNQILAQLKATDLAINVNKALADLAEAKANLDKVRAGATKQDIAVLQATVAKAETDLTNAKTDLENTKKTYNQQLENETKNILVNANSALTKVNISLQKVYDTLYYEGDDNNFSTSNTNLYFKVKNGYIDSVNQIDEAQLTYNLAVLDQTDIKINNAVDKTLTALDLTSKTLDDLVSLFSYVITTSILTQSELDTLKTTINTERTTTDSSWSTIQSGKNDLADARLSYQTKVEEAQNNVSAAEKSLAKAQADLALKEAPARIEDITLYEARVKRAQADLELAQDKYGETIIHAPVAGVITDINTDVGEQTNLSEPVLVMLADGNYEIEVDIPESDITKIDLADQVKIFLDAFSADDIFQGVVTTINPAQTEIQDVIYYRVTVSLNNEQAEAIKPLLPKIKPGMTANVEIKTAEVNDVLIIPLRAVKDKNGVNSVEVLLAEKPKSVDVSLGLKGDDGLVEVKSGLKEGDKVITFVRNNNK